MNERKIRDHSGNNIDIFGRRSNRRGSSGDFLNISHRQRLMQDEVFDIRHFAVSTVAAMRLAQSAACYNVSHPGLACQASAPSKALSDDTVQTPPRFGQFIAAAERSRRNYAKRNPRHDGPCAMGFESIRPYPGVGMQKRKCAITLRRRHSSAKIIRKASDRDVR